MYPVASGRPGQTTARASFELSGRAAQLSADSVLEALGTDPALGLSPDQTSARLAEFGPNELESGQKTSLLRLLWDGAREPFVVLLFVAGCLAIALNEVRDGLLVLVIPAPIVGAGVITEYRGGLQPAPAADPDPVARSLHRSAYGRLVRGWL
jgi:magnesium-transporting ATPase (P-type)